MNYYTIIYKDGTSELFPYMLTKKEAEEFKKSGLLLILNIHFGSFPIL